MRYITRRGAPRIIHRSPRGGVIERQGLTLALVNRNHHAEDPFSGHGMATGSPIREEMARAVPGAVIEGNGVRIVLTSESRLKFRELNALWLLGILLGLGDLSDHARVHRRTLFPCCYLP